MSNIQLLKQKLEELTGRAVILKESTDTAQLKSAVAVIFKGNKVLMGICKNQDDRLGKLCFPGGGIEGDETPYEAAKREAFEEAGVEVKCQPISWLVFEEQPSVAFILCKYQKGNLKPNHEFDNLDWYNYADVVHDKFYKNNFKALMHFVN